MRLPDPSPRGLSRWAHSAVVLLLVLTVPCVPGDMRWFGLPVWVLASGLFTLAYAIAVAAALGRAFPASGDGDDGHHHGPTPAAPEGGSVQP